MPDCFNIHQLITNYVYRRLNSIGVNCLQAKGGFYLFPDWNKFKDSLKEKEVITSRKLATYLLKNYDVAALPGSAFGMPRPHLSLRISTVDYNGETVLKKYLKNKPIDNNAVEFIQKHAPNIISACDQLESFTNSLN